MVANAAEEVRDRLHPAGTDETLFRIVDALYAAVGERDRWQGFVQALSDALRGAAVFLGLRLDRAEQARWTFRTHVRADLDAVFARHSARGLPWRRAAPRARSFDFARISDFYPDAELVESDFYREWMEPQQLAPEGPIESLATAESGVPTGRLLLFRRIGGPPFDAGALALCEALQPHLRLARQLARRLGAAERERLALADVINRLSVGIVLFDRQGRPVITNRSADAVLAQRDGLLLAADGLHASNPRDDAVLRGLLAEAIAAVPPAGTMNRSMGIARPSGDRPFVVIVAPLAEGVPGEAAEDVVACALIGDPHAGQAFTPESLQRFYSLTPAEAELIGLLTRGISLREAANLRGVSLNTVRSQLKQVFAKTDTSRQGALIRLVLTGASLYPDE